MTGQEAVNVAEGFDEARRRSTGVILTKLDGDARGGAALSLREVTGMPIKFTSARARSLDALEQFHPDRIASRILGMGDVLSLIERAQEHVDQEQAAQDAVEGRRRASSTCRTSSTRCASCARWVRWRACSA